MGDKTAIEWSDATWNPIVGCSRVSPGCDRCYAIGVAHRGMSPQHRGLTVRPEGGRVDWNGEINVAEPVMDKPLRWKRPRRIFVNSLSDLFHPEVSDETIARVFDVMARAPQHTFQVLTKRPQRMKQWVDGCAPTEAFVTHNGRKPSKGGIIVGHPDRWPLPNVWLGTSIESDKYTFRANYLRDTPAAVRWISAEPLLGPLPSLDLTDIDWVVVGGESGAGSRPMHPDWARDLRDRCVDAGVPYLFKQWGDWAPGQPDQHGRSSMSKTPTVTQRGVLLDRDGHPRDTNELTDFRMPVGWVRMARVGKKAAGRELDGRAWDEYPA